MDGSATTFDAVYIHNSQKDGSLQIFLDFLHR